MTTLTRFASHPTPLRRAWLASRHEGVEVALLEAELAKYLQVAHVVVVPSVRVALMRTLACLAPPRGRVVMSAFNYPPLIAMVERAGYAVDLVDITPGELWPSAERAFAAVGRDTVAVVLTHPFGHAAPTSEWQAYARNACVPLIEDCAQAFGSMHARHSVGSLSRAGLFSFGPTKPLGALGGGAVVTSDHRLAGRMKQMRGPLEPTRRVLRGLRAGAFQFGAKALSRIPSDHTERWLTDGFIARAPAWKRAEMGPLEARYAREQLAQFPSAMHRRGEFGRELAQRHPGVMSAPNGSSLLVSVEDARATARRLRALRIDAAYGELRDCSGGRAPNAMRRSRSLLRLPLNEGFGAEQIARLSHAIESMGTHRRGEARTRVKSTVKRVFA